MNTKSASKMRDELAVALATTLGIKSTGKPVDIRKRLNIEGYYWFSGQRAWCKIKKGIE